jgi:GT2 family glycosyltransferase
VDTKFSNANGCVRREWVERCAGNDTNFDGGYGEDSDFGRCIVEKGGVLLANPFAADLHLKPPSGGFRWWGKMASERRLIPWEFRRRTGLVKPRPSPTIVYGLRKHCTGRQVREWFTLYVLRSLWPTFLKPHETTRRRLIMLLPRLAKVPLALWKIRVSWRFSNDLLSRGPQYE